MAVWQAVFALDGERWSEASERFPGFYETRHLARLERRISQVDAAEGRGWTDRSKVLAIERNKVLRVLGQPTAGLQPALEWTRSEDPVDRLLAIGVLRTFDDPRALAALRGLADDHDPEVAVAARVSLSARTPRP